MMERNLIQFSIQSYFMKRLFVRSFFRFLAGCWFCPLLYSLPYLFINIYANIANEFAIHLLNGEVSTWIKTLLMKKKKHCDRGTLTQRNDNERKRKKNMKLQQQQRRRPTFNVSVIIIIMMQAKSQYALSRTSKWSDFLFSRNERNMIFFSVFFTCIN